MRHSVLCLVLVSIGVLLSSCESSSSDHQYPARPITYIVPWNPGGGTDASARAMAAALQDILGRPVNVINRTGGGGVIGHLALSQARPDGYTIGAMTVEITMMHWTGLTPLSYRDFTPLALLVNNAAAITVRADAPWNTVDDLLADLQTNPGIYRASGTSRGGIWDLARIGFLQSAGLPESALPWVPSQGAAPAFQELLAGGVHVVTAALVEADALRQAGQVKTLAVMSDERLERFPEIPTLREHGIDWTLGGWVSVAAPSGLPDDIRDTLVDAVEQAAKDSTFLDPMTQAGFSLQVVSAEDFEKFLERQDRINGRLMQSAGIARQ